MSELHYPALFVLFHCRDGKTDSSAPVGSTQQKKYNSTESFISEIWAST